jgi:hypothetical protein
MKQKNELSTNHLKSWRGYHEIHIIVFNVTVIIGFRKYVKLPNGQLVRAVPKKAKAKRSESIGEAEQKKIIDKE